MRTELPLVGREVELDTLSRVLDAARRGQGEAVLVTGESGIGKTRLLTEVRRRAKTVDLVVLRGCAAESSGAYRPLVEAFARPAAPYTHDPALVAARPALARILPGWAIAGDVVAPMADANAVLAEALILLMQAIAPAGATLLLDDLQWADDDTVSVVACLVDAIDDLPMSLVLAARSEPLLLDRLRRLDNARSLERLTLPRLDAEQVRNALAAIGVDGVRQEEMARLVAVIDGLPLVLDEFARQRVDGADIGASFDISQSSLAAAVRHRLSGMDADTRAVLNNLAVLGECDVALLSAVTGLSSEALSSALHRACDSTLLVETSTSLGVGWRHALIRELVGAGLLPHERQTLAHTAADQLNFLIGEGTDETCHRQAAALYELAGMPNVAAQHLVHAARSAVRSAALDAAAQDLSRAQALAGAMPEAALDVLVERTETLTLAGRAHDAYRDGVLALGTAVGRRNRRLTFATARAGYAAGLVAQASRLWTDLPADPDDPEAALLAVYDAVARRHHDVVELGEQAAQLATDRGRVDLACEALYLAGRASRRYSISRSEQLLQQTMHLSEQHGQSVWRVRVLAALGAGDLADPELGSSRLERARELAVAAGMAGTVAWIDLRLGELTILRSGYIAAYPTIARADAQARSLRLTGLGADARVRVAECRLWAADQPLPGRHRSHGGTVDDLMAEALEFGEEGIHVPYSRFVFGARAWLEGDTAAAVRIIEESLDYLREEVKFVPWWGFGKLLSVTCGNDPDTAFGPEFRRGHGVNHAAYAYAKAVVAIDHGEAHLTWIKRAEDQLGSFKFITHVLRTAIATKVFAVEPDLVRGWLREADAFCAMAGEPALQRRVRQTMAALGSKLPRSRTGTVPPHLARLGLTGRETEILRMINIGASNTDIADRLVLSVRTVESHVSSMLAKTGKLTRAELPLVAE